MIADRVRRLLQTEYEKRLMIFDFENISSCVDYVSLLRTNDFSVYFYDDIERIRYKYETEMRYTKTPCAIIVTAHLYVPTDIRRNFCEIELSLTNLYPRMDANILKAHFRDIELIDFSYDEFEQRCLLKEETAHFLQNVSFGEQNVREFIAASEVKIAEKLKSDLVFSEWINIAKENARLEKYACLYSIQRDQSFIDEAFSSFVFSRYGKLSHAVSSEAPVMLRDVIGRIATGEKTALLVADGMSMFDFEVLSDYMTDYDYSFGATFALIPTITSISRQSLLSGKYPQQLESPFTLTKEESGFYVAAQEHGFDKKEIWYSRGYNKQPDIFTRFAAIIVNDIDDMVHGQKQGRLGMYQDVNLWAKEGKLLRLIDSLLQRGFKVYLTADHGNTLCTGGGGIKRTGVETETKSRRMIVLKDFADVSDELATRTFVYPGYYCNRKFQYRICKGRTSFDNKNEIVMTHGGISLEEVVVPFVEVRKKNG